MGRSHGLSLARQAQLTPICWLTHAAWRGSSARPGVDRRRVRTLMKRMCISALFANHAPVLAIRSTRSTRTC